MKFLVNLFPPLCLSPLMPDQMSKRMLTVVFLLHYKLNTQLKHPGSSPPGAENTQSSAVPMQLEDAPLHWGNFSLDVTFCLSLHLKEQQVKPPQNTNPLVLKKVCYTASHWATLPSAHVERFRK